MLLRFKHFIKEELTPEQKALVDKWPKRSKKATDDTDYFFGKGNDDVHEDLHGTTDKSEVHRRIEHHLGQEIHPDDYKKGIHTDKYGRPTKIGKTLNKTPEGQRLLKDFNEDSTRGAKNLSGLTVHTTRSAHGVAGQTSGGQSWENQSCKNFDSGGHKGYLKHEVRHGTVVSYLKDHNGKELARTSFQPYQDEHGNTIYKRNSYYGIRHAEFEKHNEEMEKRLSKPGNETNIYHLHDKVYNDSGSSAETAVHPHAAAEHITKMMENPDPKVRAAAISHPDATSEHIEKALKDSSSTVRHAAIKHPLSEPNITKYLKDSDSDIRNAAILNPKAGEEFRKNPNSDNDHIGMALKDKSSLVRDNTIINPNVTPAHITQVLNSDDDSVKLRAIRYQKLRPEHIAMALKDANYKIRHAAVTHANARPEHIAQGLKDEDGMVRAGAVEHPNARPEHIAQGIKDESSWVRFSAINNPNATREHITQGIKDTNRDVRNLAKRKLQELDKKEMKTESVTFYKLKQWIS